MPVIFWIVPIAAVLTVIFAIILARNVLRCQAMVIEQHTEMLRLILDVLQEMHETLKGGKDEVIADE